MPLAWNKVLITIGEEMPDDDEMSDENEISDKDEMPGGSEMPGGESGLTLNRKRQYIRLRYMVINVLWRTQGANGDAMDVWRGMRFFSFSDVALLYIGNLQCSLSER